MTIREKNLTPKITVDQRLGMIAGMFDVDFMRIEGSVSIWTDGNNMTQGILVEPYGTSEYITTKKGNKRLPDITRMLGIEGKCLLITYQTNEGRRQANSLIHLDEENHRVELIEFYPKGRSNKGNILPYPEYKSEIFEHPILGKFSRRTLSGNSVYEKVEEHTSDVSKDVKFSCTYYPHLFKSTSEQYLFSKEFENGPLFS